METKVLILLCISLFFSSCKQRDIPMTQDREIVFNKADLMSDPTTGRKDSLFTNYVFKDYFYSFMFVSDKSYKIRWGNKKFSNQSDNKYETSGNGNLGLIDFNRDYILLGQSTGNSNANIRVLLPLKKGSLSIVKENVVFESLEEGIFLYEKQNSINQLELFNFRTLDSKSVSLDDCCNTAEFLICIDSVKVDNQDLEIYYQGKEWNVNQPDQKLIRVSLN